MPIPVSRTVAIAGALAIEIAAAAVLLWSRPIAPSMADAAAVSYVKTLAELHAGPGGPVIATVQPGTPVTVLATKGTATEIELSGWSPMGGAKYIFKDAGERIGRATLTDEGVAKRIVAGTKDDAWESTWENAKVDGWIDTADLVPDLGTVWDDAGSLYYSRCSRCHSLRKPREFTANQWPSVLKIMTARAGFTKDQAALVTALLQNHARDQNVDDSFAETVAARATTPEQPQVAKIVGTPKMAEEGKAAFADNSCNACHGDDAKTPIMPEYPRVAGQSPEYLVKQILDFKSGARSNDAFSAMKDAVTPISEDDARAIAYWLSTL